ncbi:MAG: tetratricopeptide repeat protein [Planctomycetota bacterium]
MDPTRWPRLKALLHAALSLDPKQRQDLIDSVDEAVLKAELVSLLQCHDTSNDFIEPPRFGSVSSLLEPSPAGELGAGDVVGRYRLVRLLGAGGMGRVYLAERADGQFTRQVAIKVLKPTLESDDFVRRFHREQRALATLAHPHIAMLLDAGNLGDGSPYIVMEYVDGIPVDDFCETHVTSIADVLALFRQICAAVAHAHQRLVVHCDLKPENILVTPDGDPKLLDFGIANLLDEESSGGAAPRGRSPLTPGYASPEQVAGERVTTISDVYALGAVLHRLLVGDARPPANDIRSTWRPPSDWVAAVSPTRARSLRGDLDSIVMKALAGDPRERYGSVQELVQDLDRFATGQPVSSRAAGFGYRATKFVRRNKGSVAAITVVCITILAGSLGIAVQARQVAQEHGHAVAARSRLEVVNRFLEQMLESPQPSELGATVSMREILDRASTQLTDAFADQPEVAATLRNTLGQSYLSLGLLEDARRELAAALAIREQGPSDEELAKARNDFGTILYHLGDFEGSRKLLFQAEQYWRQREDGELELAQVLNNLACSMNGLRDLEAASRLHEEALGLRERRLSPHDLLIAESLNNLANTHRGLGQLERALVGLARAVDIRRRSLPADHPLLLQGLSNLGVLNALLGNQEAAEALLVEALAASRRKLGADHLEVSYPLGHLGELLDRAGRCTEAEPLLRECRDIRTRSLPPEHRSLILARARWALCLHHQGRTEEAKSYLQSEFEAARGVLGESNRTVREIADILAVTLEE